MHRRFWRRTTILASVAVAAGTVLAVAPAADAAPPTSALDVSSGTILPGQTFTVSETVYNDQSFAIVNAKPSLYAVPTAVTDDADLVSCTGTTSDCYQFGSSYRAPVGDLQGGESKTVTFTLRLKDTAAPGQVTLQSQLVGDNYSFATLDGPVVTIGAPSTVADVGVSLKATPRVGLTARVDYTVTVTNSGPSTATGIRVVAATASGRQVSGASGCTRVPNTSTLNCDIASLASGATATAKFTTDAGLLTIGSFTTTVKRQNSAPGDPNAKNDGASRTCTALTGLLVSC